MSGEDCYVRLFDFFDNKPSHFIIPFSSIMEATNFCKMYIEKKSLNDSDVLCTAEEPLPQYDGELGMAQGGQVHSNLFFQLFLGYGSTYTRKYDCDYKIISQTELSKDTSDPKKFQVFETFQEFIKSI